MDINVLRIAATLASMVLFFGILAWAMAGRNRARFEEAAQLPLIEE